MSKISGCLHPNLGGKAKRVITRSSTASMRILLVMRDQQSIDTEDGEGVFCSGLTSDPCRRGRLSRPVAEDDC